MRKSVEVAMVGNSRLSAINSLYVPMIIGAVIMALLSIFHEALLLCFIYIIISILTFVLWNKQTKLATRQTLEELS